MSSPLSFYLLAFCGALALACEPTHSASGLTSRASSAEVAETDTTKKARVMIGGEPVWVWASSELEPEN